MLILIEKDAQNRVPRECTQEQAIEFAESFPVFVVADDGETLPLAQWLAAQAPAAPADPK